MDNNSAIKYIPVGQVRALGPRSQITDLRYEGSDPLHVSIRIRTRVSTERKADGNLAKSRTLYRSYKDIWPSGTRNTSLKITDSQGEGSDLHK